MVMTIHKLTAGDGYTYLTRQVAGGDVARDPGQDAAGYYAAGGNPPGMWIGRGAPLLGLDGKQVTEEQMRALFGYGQHPNADQMITVHLEARTRPGMTRSQLARAREDAIRTATLGRPFPSYEPLEKFEVRVRRRLAIITEETGRDPTQAEIKKIHREEARRQRAAVAGFDAVYVQEAPAGQPAAPAAPVLTACGNYLYVNADTSCPFAQNVEANYTGLGVDYADSPVTGQDYTMNCVAGYGNLNGGDSVVCTGGDNALVEWPAN